MSSDAREALRTLTLAFEERLARERAARLRAEAALLAAATARTATDGYSCFSIGTVRSPFTADHGGTSGAPGAAPTLRGAPRQGALAPDTRAVIELSPFLPAAALDGLAEYSHVFVFWLFNDDDAKPRGAPPAAMATCPWVVAGRPYAAKVSPPGLFGVRTGVFATRSPHRPNAIGVSLCALRGVEAGGAGSGGGSGGRILLAGVDLFDGTPVVDIKPACEYDCGACGARLEAAVPRGAVPPPPPAVQCPPWVEGPLNSPPPLRVVWAPAASEAARASVMRGRARYYAGSDAAEAGAFLRAITQVIRLDPRSVAHGRGTPTARHVTALESARAAAVAAVEDGGGGAAHEGAISGCASDSRETYKTYVLRYDCVLLRLAYRPENDPEISRALALESPAAATVAATASPAVFSELSQMPLRDAGGEVPHRHVCLVEHCEDVPTE